MTSMTMMLMIDVPQGSHQSYLLHKRVPGASQQYLDFNHNIFLFTMLKPLVLLLYSNLLVLVLFHDLSHNVLANHVQDTGIGPCFIRRTRLPRLDGIKVKYIASLKDTRFNKRYSNTNINIINYKT